MKDCCNSGPKTKKCKRKSDNKTFTFPRRFSKKHCLTKKIKGFTMRASCAPYKDCKKGGSKHGKKNNILSKIIRSNKDPTYKVTKDKQLLLSFLAEDNEDKAHALNQSFERERLIADMDNTKDFKKDQTKFDNRVKNRVNKIKMNGGKFDNHRNIEKDSYEDALDKPELEIPITDDAFYELSDSSYDLNQNIPDVSLNLDDSNLDSTRFSDIANDTSITDLSFDQDEIFENPPSPIRRQRGGLPAEEVNRRIRRAIHYGTAQRVRELIQSAEGNFDINDEWNGGFTLLTIAADKGRADIVKVLLQNGADPNRVAEMDFGRSSLKRAAIRGHMDVVEVLLESGANVRQLDLNQRSSIWYAIDNQNYDIARRLIREAFEKAAVNGNVYTVENAIQDRVLSIPPLKTYFYENYAIYNSDNVPNRPLPTLPPILKDEVASYIGGKSRKKRNRKRRKHKTTKKRKKNIKRKK